MLLFELVLFRVIPFYRIFEHNAVQVRLTWHCHRDMPLIYYAILHDLSDNGMAKAVWSSKVSNYIKPTYKPTV